MQKALITGASGGIGKELAIVMAKAGHDLVLVARRKGELEAVKKEIKLQSDVDVSLRVLDLSLPGAAKELYLKTKDQDVGILVNNAGVGLKGNFFNDDPVRTKDMAYLNMISLMELSQLFGQDFLKKNSGRILNIASIAAFIPGPKQAVYYASKSFVREFSRALAYNVRGTGVTVTVLHPGVTKTEFFNSAQAYSIKGGASARSVAELGYRAMMQGKIEVTHGLKNKILTNFLVRILPYRYHSLFVDKASDA